MSMRRIVDIDAKVLAAMRGHWSGLIAPPASFQALELRDQIMDLTDFGVGDHLVGAITDAVDSMQE